MGYSKEQLQATRKFANGRPIRIEYNNNTSYDENNLSTNIIWDDDNELAWVIMPNKNSYDANGYGLDLKLPAASNNEVNPRIAGRPMSWMPLCYGEIQNIIINDNTRGIDADLAKFDGLSDEVKNQIHRWAVEFFDYNDKCNVAHPITNVGHYTELDPVPEPEPVVEPDSDPTPES